MSRHFEHAIEKIKKDLLSLSAMVEEALRNAVKSLEDRDAVLAEQVISQDNRVDQAEVDVEEECLKTLALHQPVAIDLRFIVAVLKINSDLERIGDLAVNMAERSKFLSQIEMPDIPFDFHGMAERTQDMLRKSLDSLVNMNSDLALDVMKADDAVDAINREMYELVKAGIKEHPEHLDALIHLLSASRHLERIADHATNIAEDVIYMMEGTIVRHNAENFG